MKKLTPFLFLITITLLFGNCMGIRHLTIDTREPGQIAWSPNVSSVVVVNNVVQQPNDIGHSQLALGQTNWERATASFENMAIYYTTALAEFLADEEHFEQVLFFPDLIRTDRDFFMERPLTPELMGDIMRRSGADAVISLDRLLMQTDVREYFVSEGLPFGRITARIQSVIRVYMPVLTGEIPVIHYSDSLTWRGFDVDDSEMRYFIDFLPTREEAMTDLIFRAAERMTSTLSPHWVAQERWYYTSLNARMREGQRFAQGNQWDRALDRWQTAYNGFSRRADRARAAHNIALAYEMLDDIETALDWSIVANGHFVKSTSPNSLERRRSALYKAELQRRWNNIIQMNREDFEMEE
jgi:hypothetical protein